MSKYDYECQTCKETYEVIQSMKEDKLKEYECPKCGSVQPCVRLISGGCGTHFLGNGWTVNSKTRGYGGKFGDKIRPVGSPVDAPAVKAEADAQFNRWVESGGLDGIKPSFNINDRNNPARPQTAEQMIDKKYK